MEKKSIKYITPRFSSCGSRVSVATDNKDKMPISPRFSSCGSRVSVSTDNKDKS